MVSLHYVLIEREIMETVYVYILQELEAAAMVGN